MPCPICTHTMQRLGVDDRRIYWCPRCGTLKEESGDHESFEIPKLATYVREAAGLTAPTSLDSKHLVFAVPAWHWRAACEAVGVTPLGTPKKG